MINCFCGLYSCTLCSERASVRETNRLKSPHLRRCGNHRCTQDGDYYCWDCQKEGSLVYDTYWRCGYDGYHE